MMGTPTLYYYPTTSLSAGTVGLLEKVDFGEPISDIQLTPLRRVSDTVALSGRTSRTSWTGGLGVRIVLERFTDDTLAEALETFSSHAERGKHFGFALDPAKAVAVVPRGTEWTRGATTVQGQGNIFRKWEPSATLANGDKVTIEGPHPRANREANTISAYSATSIVSSITFGRALRYDVPYPGVLRHHDFYPVLMVPESEIGRPMLTHDHRISYTWECQAVMYPWWAAALSAQAEAIAGGQVAPEDSVGIDGLLSGGRTSGLAPTLVTVDGKTAFSHDERTDTLGTLGDSTPYWAR